MNDRSDTAQVLIRPPVALALAAVAALALEELSPMPITAGNRVAVWAGAIVVAIGMALVAWAIVKVQRAGSNVPTDMPTTTIVDTGPYAFSRNPIYLGAMAFLAGLAVALDTGWLLAVLVPFALVIRYGVVAREEAYLERKFGDEYRSYRSRVRRWL
jgi:protein-S-isoprenylcysteine O-methyltransferase Ste14